MMAAHRESNERRAAFTDDEEAFFAAGHQIAEQRSPADSFDDLEREPQPKGFWQRLMSRPEQRRPDNDD